MSLDNLPRTSPVKAPDVKEDTDQVPAGDIKFFTIPVILGPNITGMFTTHNHLPAYNGAFYGAGSTGVGLGYASTIAVLLLKMDANRCSAIYGNGEAVQPSSLIFNYVIKY